MSNPYTIIFGKEPSQMIPRNIQSSQILDAFTSEYESNTMFMITGLRGSGKTVLLSEIANKLRKDPSWIVIDLNTQTDMRKSMISFLSHEKSFIHKANPTEVNISVLEPGMEIKDNNQIEDDDYTLISMLETIKKNKKKVLVTIDEASNTSNMRVFAMTYQILIRRQLPVYLLMTGLYENISELQNVDNLTFLYRAPKIPLKSLDIRMIAENYATNFHLEAEEARKMARMTKGYSYAFQVLGYLTWNNGGSYKEVIDDYRQYLNEYVYHKIWSELSETDRKIAYGIAKVKSGKIRDIRGFLKIKTNQFNPYRRRLIKKGLVDGETYGYVSFTLPLFDQFVIDIYEEDFDQLP